MELNLNNIKLNIQGESHSKQLDIIALNFPKEEFDYDLLQTFMNRRHGDGSYLSELCCTQRKEKDVPIIDEYSNTILKAHIMNNDANPDEYKNLRNVLRPGHADLGAYLKYGRDGLKTGGGEFSGRMTAGLCLVGGIAKQILAKRGIEINAYILQIAGINVGFLDEEDEAEFITRIESIKSDGDSCGGVVGCTVKGMPGGVGGPGTDGLEGDFARALLAIPSAKGVEFGSGFDGTYYTGSVNNDEYYIIDDKIFSKSNKQGGISGGISTGMNITMNVAFKPVPSIKIKQKTVDIEKMHETTIEIKGRNDVCIIPRVLPVVEAVAALVVLDRLEKSDE